MSDLVAGDDDLSGWCVIEFGEELHIVPCGEEERHHPQDCTCEPTPEADDTRVIVHHSFDGREAFERGVRKPS